MVPMLRRLRRPVDPAWNDLAECRALLESSSRSFVTAARLLPRRVREPATALYAFCRVADDLVDQGEAGDSAVERLRARLDRLYNGAPEPHPVDRAFARVVADHGLPRALPDALLEGLQWDHEGRRYESFDDLCAYGVRVAGAIGLMMACVTARRDPVTLARACDLGVAMQLTNVARDVGHDARAGRFYLPLRWVRRTGVDVEAFLAEPRFTHELGSVVARLLRAAEVLYHRADGGIARLPRDCRLAVRAARLVYSDVGREIRRAGFDSVSRRAVVSSARQVALIGSAADVLVRGAGPLDAPWLEPARPLIEAVAR
jgi:15-cis-phytoene synthase